MRCSERLGINSMMVFIHCNTVASGSPAITKARNSKSLFSRILCWSTRFIQCVSHGVFNGVECISIYVVTYVLIVFQRLRQRALPTHAPVMVKCTTNVGLRCSFSDENVDLKDENNCFQKKNEGC